MFRNSLLIQEKGWSWLNLKEEMRGKQRWDCGHTCQGSSCQRMEGWQEAHGQAPLPAKVVFFMWGTIFKRSQT